MLRAQLSAQNLSSAFASWILTVSCGWFHKGQRGQAPHLVKNATVCRPFLTQQHYAQAVSGHPWSVFSAQLGPSALERLCWGQGFLKGQALAYSIPKPTRKKSALKTQPRKENNKGHHYDPQLQDRFARLLECICMVVGECSVDLLLPSGGAQRMACWHALARRQTQLLELLRLHPKHTISKSHS